MSTRAKRIWKYAGIAALVFVAAGLRAPYQPVNFLAPEIRHVLVKALGRNVEFDDVHLNLFTGPGFSISKVRIYEDPAVGAEPLAYVGSLEARPKLWALLRGRLEFASLRLDDASVNLAKMETPAGATVWNAAPLLDRTVFTALPALHVRFGRINFKSGDTKSTLYITDADLDIDPPSTPAGDWRIDFKGEPARTDRPARGFGSLRARGRWSPKGKLDMEVQLDKSAIHDFVSLAYGRDFGVHGTVSSRIRIQGETTDLKITGQLRIEDVHRWDLGPQGGETWPLTLEGRLNFPGQQLELVARSLEKDTPTFLARFRAADYLAHPRWGTAFYWNHLRMAPLLQLARHLGAPVPAELGVDGVMDGAIGYSTPRGFQGQLAFGNGALTIPQSPPLRFEQAQLLIDGDRVHLLPAVVRTSNDELATIEADYRWNAQALDLSIGTEAMHVADLRSQVALAAVPLLEQLESGVWKGHLRYQRDAEGAGAWSGMFQLRDSQVALPGVTDPLMLASAQARLDGQRLLVSQIQAAVGVVTLRGEYRYEPKATRPHRFRLDIPALTIMELEREFLPTLRRSQGLIARALNFGRAPLPDWLNNRRVEGTVQIGSLDAGDYRWEKLRGRVVWDGAQAEFSDLTGRFAEGAFSGRAAVDLSAAEPVYHLIARLKSVDWNGGKLNAELSADAAGTGEALLASLRSEGSFSGQGFDSEPLDQFQLIEGCYVFAAVARAPRLRLTDLRLSAGKELFIGQGATQDDGRLLVQLSSPARQLNVSGSLAQLRLDEVSHQ